MRYYKRVALAIFVWALSLGFSPTSSHALSFDVIREPGLLTQKDALFGVFVSDLAEETEAMYDVNLGSGETTQDQAFGLDPNTGEVTFGDGLRGRVPPAGAGGTAAAYRYGSGSAGIVIDPFPIHLHALPVLIPLDDLSTMDVAETEISFFLLGIRSLNLEVVESGVWITAITPIPEPSTMFLVGSGLLGVAGLRRRFRMKRGTFLLLLSGLLFLAHGAMPNGLNRIRGHAFFPKGWRDV